MNKRTLIAGLVLFAGAPVAAQINDVDPNSDTKIARRAARVNPAAERALVARSNPIDVGGVVYHGSASIPAGVGGANEVFMFDAAGNLTGQYDQIAGAISDAWGYRDGASDGEFVYFGWGGGVARHDADGSNGILLFDGLNCPGTCRALAFDPTGDGGRGSFWTISFGSDLVELDMAGNEINFFFSDGWSVYGLSYDDNDGNLWAHSRPTVATWQIIKIDTTTGLIIPGVGWDNNFPNGAAQGGLSGFSELGGNLAAVSQGGPDEFGVYDTAASVFGSPGVLVLGPIDMQGQTGSGGHLGIAVISVDTCPCACNFDTSTGQNVCDLVDFTTFAGLFAIGDPCACDIDTSTGQGVCDLVDFTTFAGQFAGGCP